MATAKSRPAPPRSPAARAPTGARPPAAVKRAAPAAPPERAASPAAAPKRAASPAAAPKRAAVAAPGPAETGAPKGAAAPEAARVKAPVERAAAALVPGQPAPPFALASDAGHTVSLRDFNGKSLVLYFYPKDDTPGCTREACAFQEALASLAARGAAVVGVSRDGPTRHVRFKAKYGLTFPLLSDPEGATHRAYGAWGVKKLYGRESIGPLRTTVVIDGSGCVARVFSNVRVDGHADEVLAALGGGKA